MSFKMQPKAQMLCDTCKHGQKITYSNSSEQCLCHAEGTGVPIQILRTVTSCTKYHQKGLPSHWEFEKIAWKIKADKRNRFIGFEAPGQD